MTDFFKTRAQLKERAAKDLGVLLPGEALSTEDNETLDGLVDPLIAQLAADDIVYVSDTEEIALEYFLPLASLLANTAGPDFGSPVNDDAKRRDEATLKRIVSTRPTYDVAEGNYF